MLCICNSFIMKNSAPCINTLSNTVEVQPFFEEMPAFFSERIMLAIPFFKSYIYKKIRLLAEINKDKFKYLRKLNRKANWRHTGNNGSKLHRIIV